MWWFIVFDFINLVWLQIVPRLNCHAQMASDLKKIKINFARVTISLKSL